MRGGHTRNRPIWNTAPRHSVPNTNPIITSQSAPYTATHLGSGFGFPDPHAPVEAADNVLSIRRERNRVHIAGATQRANLPQNTIDQN